MGGPSIEEELAERGYGHRKMRDDPDSGVHEIYRLDTGETIANHTALGAYEAFCREPR